MEKKHILAGVVLATLATAFLAKYSTSAGEKEESKNHIVGSNASDLQRILMKDVVEACAVNGLMIR